MKTVKFLKGSSKFNRLFFLLAITLGITMVASTANGQTYKAVAGSIIKVDGSSNLHDWVMQASSFSGEAQLVFQGSNVTDISALTFSLPVKNLKAKEDLMNSRAYKAMKADKFPTVAFKLTSAQVSGSSVKATGALTIAGVTKTASLDGKITENADGSVTVTGARKIKMSEFGIEPPTFMLGALKVTDEVTVEYTLKLKK